jgi:hypothetical protein
VQSQEKPLYLPVKPFLWSRVNCCDLNVQKVVNDNGGEKVYGFKIWSIPKMYIEADLHCVWKEPRGNFIDITPNVDGEEKILFLPDPELTTVRLARKGEKPRLALRDSLIDFVDLKREQEMAVGFVYSPDEVMWKDNISYKRLKKKINKARK